MTTEAMNSVSGVGANSSVDGPTGGDASNRNIDSTAGELSQSLTGGGKANFDSPGQQKDFNNGLHDAVHDMSKGAERASSEGKSPMQDKQFQDGMKQLIQLIGQLLSQKGEGKGDKEGGKGAGKPEGAGGAEGAGAAEKSGGGDDMIKKLVALLKKMGMGDKEIAALLGKLGVPADGANKAMQGAGQAEGDSPADSGMGAADSTQTR